MEGKGKLLIHLPNKHLGAGGPGRGESKSHPPPPTPTAQVLEKAAYTNQPAQPCLTLQTATPPPPPPHLEVTSNPAPKASTSIGWAGLSKSGSLVRFFVFFQDNLLTRKIQ